MSAIRGSGVMMAAILAAVAVAARAGDEVPRYRLEPGMELSYKGSSTLRHQDGMHIDDQETTAPPPEVLVPPRASGLRTP
jgi:hypothetical protein